MDEVSCPLTGWIQEIQRLNHGISQMERPWAHQARLCWLIYKGLFSLLLYDMAMEINMFNTKIIINCL